MGANVRSTVGTATDANAMLRILFSRLGQPHIGSPQAFAFNVPSVRAAGAITVERGDRKTVRKSFTVTGGMCPRCEGMGSVTDIDLSQLYDEGKSLSEGAITVPGYKPGGWMVQGFAESGFLDPDKPIRDYTKKELHDFLYREPTKVKVNTINLTYEGLVPKVQKSFFSKDRDSLQPHIRAFVDRAATFTACPDCGGTRLSEAARSSRIDGMNIADVSALQISDLAGWVGSLNEPSVAPLLGALRADPRRVRGDRARLPVARPAVGDAVGRGVAAHQDDSPPRFLAHRRDVHLRRAHHRPASPRHPADERAAAPATGQGQHGARRRAQA